MADPETPATAQDAGELDEALLRAISHPLRHRLLGMLDGRTASPNQLARELGLPLGRVSYHIRLLNDLGAIELVGTEPRRGALEHFYRAVTTVWFNEADWSKLPRSARRGILGQNLQHIFASVTKAADSGGFDHPASAVLRAPLELDDEGMTELSRAAARLARPRARDQRAGRRAARRRRRQRPRPSSRSSTSSVPHKLPGMAGLRRALVAIAAALALADASIVALALPPILVEFDTTITGVAAIVGVYALVLALAILPARRLRPGAAGLLVFAAASVGCAIAGSLWLLLRLPRAAGGRRRRRAADRVRRAGRGRVARRAAAVARRRARRHRRRAGDRRRADRAVRLARDLRGPGADRARGGARDQPRRPVREAARAAAPTGPRSRGARAHRRRVHRGAVPARDRARRRLRDLAAAGRARRLRPAARGAGRAR